MDSNEDWARTALRLEELTRDLTDIHDVEDTLDAALQVAIELAPCDVASVSMHRPSGKIETTAASAPIAERAHATQVQLGEGPCLEAQWGERDIYVVSNLVDDRRWPRWSPEAEALGLRSLIAVRLFTSKQSVGALDLYSSAPREYDADDVLSARILGARVSSTLARLKHEETLWDAINARHDVGLAQGILMERFGITSDQAFGVLRRYSQQQNRKLRAIAAEVIETRRLPSGREHGSG